MENEEGPMLRDLALRRLGQLTTEDLAALRDVERWLLLQENMKIKANHDYFVQPKTLT